MIKTCELSDSIDEIIIQPRLLPVSETYNNSRVLDISILQESVEYIRKLKFDVYIDLHGIFQSSLVGSLAQIPVRLGRSHHTGKDGAHLFYSHICSIEQRSRNKMESHITIAKSYFNELEFPTVNSKDWLDKSRVALLPGSSEVGVLKRWGVEKYIELAIKISRSNNVVIILGPEETDIFEDLSVVENEMIRIIKINDWKDYTRLIETCRYVVGNDSAALHLSIWKEIPTFMICGPTSGAVNGVWQYGTGRTIALESECLECNVWSGKCLRNHECMDLLAVEDVFKKINETMNILEENEEHGYNKNNKK
jgi:heptosyltransferase-2